MDIVIYTNGDTLFHKLKFQDQYCWWSMSRPPKDFKVGDRIWFAISGEIQGYFVSDGFDPEDDERTIEFQTKSWEGLDGVESWQFCKSFRGFRYKWWDKEVK